MIKVILLLTRREGISVEEFQQYAREHHVPLLRQLPGLRRLVVNYAAPDHTGVLPPYDAIAEDWFESGMAMAAAFQSPTGEAVQRDGPNFLDMHKFQMIVVEEEEVITAHVVTAEYSAPGGDRPAMRA